MGTAPYVLTGLPTMAIPIWNRDPLSESGQERSRNDAESDPDKRSERDEELEQEDANKSTDGSESHDEYGKEAESVESEQEEKVFNWEWVKSRRQQQAMKKHLKDRMNLANIALFAKRGTLKLDPRRFQHGSQWRDHLRAVLGLRNQALKLDLAYIDLEDDDGNRVNIYGNAEASFEERKMLFRTKDVIVLLRMEII